MITPEGVPVLFAAKPENAASTVKILALSNHSLHEEIKKYQHKKKAEVTEADKEIKKGLWDKR